MLQLGILLLYVIEGYIIPEPLNRQDRASQGTSVREQHNRKLMLTMLDKLMLVMLALARHWTTQNQLTLMMLAL